MPYVPPKPGEYDYKFYGGITTAEVAKSFKDNFTFSWPLIDDTERVVYSDRPEFKNVKNAKIIVIGGGGSAKDLSGIPLREYDEIWTMNYGFKHPDLNGIIPNHLWVGFEVGLPALADYLLDIRRTGHQPMLGFLYGKRHIDNKSIININLGPAHNKYCIYPKLFTILGVGVRMVWWAAYLGAREIHFVGFDGLPAIEKRDHAFQSGKSVLPSVARHDWNFAKQLFVYQYDKFWTKMKTEFPHTHYYNLAQDKNPYHRLIQ